MKTTNAITFFGTPPSPSIPQPIDGASHRVTTAAGVRSLRFGKECGLREIRETGLVVEVGFSSFDDFWLPHLEGQAQAGAYVKSLSPERQLALRERLRQEIAARATEGAFSLRAQAVAVRGTC